MSLKLFKNYLFRQTSRVKFSQMRRDVLEKLELVDAKFQSDFPLHAKSILRRRGQHQRDTAAALQLASVFPIEADLEQETLENYGVEIKSFQSPPETTDLLIHMNPNEPANNTTSPKDPVDPLQQELNNNNVESLINLD